MKCQHLIKWKHTINGGELVVPIAIVLLTMLSDWQDCLERPRGQVKVRCYERILQNFEAQSAQMARMEWLAK